ncbi:plexin domain-containing protein 2 [Anabrus simplex]|uniref:plexin domain-containing protein 2 n=1 Tax=Anabrus simplex TaxID=316456 RepID=UPI0035A29E5B
MALVVRWWCACYSVLFLVFLGDAVFSSYSGLVEYPSLHGDSEQTEVVIRTLEGSLLQRKRRYLAEDASDPQSDPEETINVSSDVQPGKGAPQLENSSVSKTSDATSVSLSSTSVSTSEPKTGGNYVAAVRGDNVTKSNNSASDDNRTSQPKNATQYPPVSKSPNQIPLLQHPVNATQNVSDVLPSASKPNSTIAFEDITITKFPEDHLSNKTLMQHNITNQQVDQHLYYNSTSISNDKKLCEMYWVSMENNSNAQVSKLLSQSHRRAATVKLSFDFPFYGNPVRNVTIATGGFLYTGDYVHSWLAATQYIAPLMANFDTSLSNDSYVKYVDNGTAFTVQWIKVKLQDKPESGEFTFQATLLKSGDIIFVYQNVPIVVDQITDDSHPVKVGLSDAYIIDRTIFFVRRKTIYEYHRVNFQRQAITNWTVIYLSALHTCLEGSDCQSCLTLESNFVCKWCPGANRCSNGMDRFRQEWLLRDCEDNYVSNTSYCPAATEYVPTEIHESPTQSSIVGQLPHNAAETTPDVTISDMREPGSVSVSSVIGVLFLVAMLLSVSLWVLYAYRNPHTASGQFLIKYRPSQWSWRRGEARYTAATIHM